MAAKISQAYEQSNKHWEVELKILKKRQDLKCAM